MNLTLVISALLAMCAHELNRAYCAAMGDFSQLPWADAPQLQKDSVLMGVAMHLANPNATPEQSHESWLAQKTAEGWSYGPVKDAALKQHPCFLPYAELPEAQKAKDHIFRAAVHSVSAAFKELIAAMPAPVALPAVMDPNLLGVTFIHNRLPEWTDQNYGTGLHFTQGQTRYLPTEIAQRLLRHQDLFQAHQGEPVADDGTLATLAQAGQAQAQEHQEQNTLMDQHDSVSQMGKDELAQYALTNFKQTLNKSQKVGELRSQVKQLLDQFGTV
jgi:hypothetical protein